MVLLPHEFDAYRRLCDALNADYNPQTEIEKQLVQHIADCNMRLNRIAAIESNMFSFGAANLCRGQAAGQPYDEAAEQTIAQTCAWIKDADSFEKLDRYEGRISRQLLNYIRELERIQNLRQSRHATRPETPQPEPVNSKLASSCSGQRPPRTMTAVAAVPCSEPAPAVPGTAQNHPEPHPENALRS